MVARPSVFKYSGFRRKNINFRQLSPSTSLYIFHYRTLTMPEWANDASLFELMRTTLYTSVVGDILDNNGRFVQFLPPAVRPLLPKFTLAGRAMPVLLMDVFGH